MEKSNFEIKLFYKDQACYEDLTTILRKTDKDFIPSLTAKYNLTDVVKKYMTLAHIFLAYIGEVPVGLVTFYPNVIPKDSYLSLIAVDKNFRGKGIGKELEMKCIDFCKDFNSKGLMLNMRKSNKKLLSSRLGMGYRVVKEYTLSYSDEKIVDLYLNFK